MTPARPIFLGLKRSKLRDLFLCLSFTFFASFLLSNDSFGTTRALASKSIGDSESPSTSQQSVKEDILDTCLSDVDEKVLKSYVQSYPKLSDIVPLDIAAFPEDGVAVFHLPLGKMKFSELLNVMKRSIKEEDVAAFVQVTEKIIWNCLLPSVSDDKATQLMIFDWNGVKLLPWHASLQASKKFSEAMEVKISGIGKELQRQNVIILVNDSPLVKMGVQKRMNSLPKGTKMHVVPKVSTFLDNDSTFSAEHYPKQYFSSSTFSSHSLKDKLTEIRNRLRQKLHLD